MRKIVSAALVLAVCCACASQSRSQAPTTVTRSHAPAVVAGVRAPTGRQPVVVVVSAHRGGAGQWPQDSLTAFRHAIAAGYGELEADAWVTRDGGVVIYHDAAVTPSRCRGPYLGRLIRGLTLAQLARVRCNGQPIPTERQLIALVAAHPPVVLRLEAKSYRGQPAARARECARRVAEPVVAAGLAPRTIMEDFDWSGIAGFHEADPALRVSALITRPALDDVHRAAALGAYDLSYDVAAASAALNRAISAAGLVPTVWGGDAVPTYPGHPSRITLRAAERSAEHAVALGALVVITNYPAAVRHRLTPGRAGGPMCACSSPAPPAGGKPGRQLRAFGVSRPPAS